MSVVILGMEMPTSCLVCDIFPCFKWDENVHEEGRSEGCPLIPLPEKHGDLIDRDDVLFSFLVLGLEGERVIEIAPTIVEAEGKP